MDRKEMQNARLYLLTALLVLVLVAYFFVLYDVQVIHHDEYAAKAIRSIVRSAKVEASPRGKTATRPFSAWSSSARRRAWPGATTSPSPGWPPTPTP